MFGTATLTNDGVTYKADWNIVAGMLHLHIADHRTVVAVTLAGATNQESADYVLRLFVENRAHG
jgi:hypothetical protein